MSAVLANSDLIYMVTASKYVNSVCDRMQEFYDKRVPICIATKGIEESSEELLSNIVAKKLKTKHIAVISGPSFAIDIIKKVPIGLSLASKNEETKKIIINALQKLDNSDNKPYFSKEDYKILKNLARDRNYYCHQCAIDFGYIQNFINSTEYKKNYSKLQSVNTEIKRMQKLTEDFRFEILKKYNRIK